jgi:hypothetical protein
MGKKATKAEKETRVNKVYELLISGARRYQVLQYAASAESGWNVKPRMVDNYIQEANALIASEAEYHRAREIGRAIASLDDLYRRAIKDSEYHNALAARRELNQLLSLYEPPATQTLRIEGLDAAQLQTLADALAAHNLKPSEVFEALLEEIATRDGS